MRRGAAGEAELANLNRTGLPIVNDQVTLTVMGREAHLASEPTNWNALKVPQMFEELTNVHIEWQVVPSNAVQQKKNLAFASGDLPDLFFPGIISQADEVKYGGLGLLIPLNDLVEEWAPNVAALFERGAAGQARRHHPERQHLFAAEQRELLDREQPGHPQHPHRLAGAGRHGHSHRYRPVRGRADLLPRP